jgi:hypothetical protein
MIVILALTCTRWFDKLCLGTFNRRSEAVLP